MLTPRIPEPKHPHPFWVVAATATRTTPISFGGDNVLLRVTRLINGQVIEVLRVTGNSSDKHTELKVEDPSTDRVFYHEYEPR